MTRKTAPRPVINIEDVIRKMDDNRERAKQMIEDSKKMIEAAKAMRKQACRKLI